MNDLFQYEHERNVALVRDMLMNSGELPNGFVAEIEVERVSGWRFQFVPGKGPLAGQFIERTFITGDGSMQETRALLFKIYGDKSAVYAGRSLSTEGQFGWWRPRD